MFRRFAAVGMMIALCACTKVGQTVATSPNGGANGPSGPHADRLVQSERDGTGRRLMQMIVNPIFGRRGRS